MLLTTLPPRSNRASWSEIVEVRDEDTNELIDLAAYTITLSIAPQGCWPDDPTLTASTTDGTIVILDIGVFKFSFTAAQMNICAPTNFDIGAIVTLADETEQLLIGSFPIIGGIVRAA